MDKWILIAGTCVPAWFWFRDGSEPKTGELYFYVLVWLGVVIALRLIISPYFIWKITQDRIATLEEELSKAKSLGWTYHDTQALVQKELIKTRLELAPKILDISNSMLPFRFEKWRELYAVTHEVFEQCQPFYDGGRLKSIIFNLRFAMENSWYFAHATDTNIPSDQLTHIANDYNLCAARYGAAAYDLIMGNGENTRSFEILDDVRHRNPFEAWTTKELSAHFTEEGPDVVKIYLLDELLWHKDIAREKQD